MPEEIAEKFRREIEVVTYGHHKARSSVIFCMPLSRTFLVSKVGGLGLVYSPRKNDSSIFVLA